MATDEFVIFPPHEAFYITSLLFCTQSAFASTELLSELLSKHGSGPYEFALQPALNQVQNIVLQGAAISRFLWPTGGKYKKRGEVLRNALGTTESSPLFSRTLRNRMEHFDEYLDDYLQTITAGSFIPDYFGPKPSGDRGPFHLFRAYFTDTGEFEILGATFLVPPIADEIGRIHNLLTEWDRNGSRLRGRVGRSQQDCRRARSGGGGSGNDGAISRRSAERRACR